MLLLPEPQLQGPNLGRDREGLWVCQWQLSGHPMYGSVSECTWLDSVWRHLGLGSQPLGQRCHDGSDATWQRRPAAGNLQATGLCERELAHLQTDTKTKGPTPSGEAGGARR